MLLAASLTAVKERLFRQLAEKMAEGHESMRQRPQRPLFVSQWIKIPSVPRSLSSRLHQAMLVAPQKYSLA